MSANILIVDDVEAARNLMQALLEADGYKIILASEGGEAIELARTNSPDLILMDISLLGMDGAEAAKTIKSDPNCAHIPILAMTAHLHFNREHMPFFDGFLYKPIRLERLKSAIADAISQSGLS